jgi:AhpD family alkylhydroperoxidase
MKNPGVVIPDALTAIRALNEAIKQGGVPPRTLDLVHLRASQINGCSVCVGAAAKAKKDGASDERPFTLVAWRDTPFFTDAKRAALALTEAGARRDMERGGPPLRRASPGRTGSLNCGGERLQPRQRRQQAGPGRASSTCASFLAHRD